MLYTLELYPYLILRRHHMIFIFFFDDHIAKSQQVRTHILLKYWINTVSTLGRHVRNVANFSRAYTDRIFPYHFMLQPTSFRHPAQYSTSIFQHPRKAYYFNYLLGSCQENTSPANTVNPNRYKMKAHAVMCAAIVCRVDGSGGGKIYGKVYVYA